MKEYILTPEIGKIIFINGESYKEINDKKRTLSKKKKYIELKIFYLLQKNLYIIV